MKKESQKPDVLEDAIVSILAALVFTVITRLIKIALLVIRFL